MSSDPLLLVARYLNGEDINPDRIYGALYEANTHQLIPTFAFVFFWLSPILDTRPGKVHHERVRCAFTFIDIILNKVPPIVLFSGIGELNWGLQKPPAIILDYFANLIKRMFKIARFGCPYALEDRFILPESLYTRSKASNGRNKPVVELDTHPWHHEACKKLFKKMVKIGRASCRERV